MHCIRARSMICMMALAAILAGQGGTLQAAPVAVELSLLIDVSSSVDNGEFTLQKNGYVNAFNSPTIHAIIAAQPGGIAVNFIQWSSAFEQIQTVSWMHLTNAASSIAFANALAATSRQYSGDTAPGSAINFAVPLFSGNGFEGVRKVIDVSGDGAANEGDNTAAARDAALAAGINQINGLPILGQAGLLAWYQNNIQGGTGSFTMAASDFNSFGTAIQQKLAAEITGGNPTVPVPPSAVLMGLGAVSVMARFRRGRQLAG